MIAIKVEMCKLDFPEHLIKPMMERYGISKDEATARWRLFADSGILNSFDLEDPEAGKAMNDFMLRPSSETYPDVLWTKCIVTCLENGHLVHQYDKATGGKMAEVLRCINEGVRHMDEKSQMDMFSGYVRRNVFMLLIENPNQTIYL